MKNQLIDSAKQVLFDNDRGHYTVPTQGLYPFQWNWDSALSALGFAHFDEARAWTEISTLFEHQWDDGMVPHIIFHQPDDGYYPGPDVWQTDRQVPTSGITQPPVTGFVVWLMYQRAIDKELAREKAGELLPLIHRWHQWFFRCRDPQNSGLVALLHPWESGRDNSVDWDEAFSRVPTVEISDFVRRDTSHANPEHRPTDEQYKRYIWLVQKFRSLGWDNTKLHDASPFQLVDPGFNAILIRSCSDLAELADLMDQPGIAAESRSMASRGIAAMEKLWSDNQKQYLCFDRTTGLLIDSPSVAGILAAFAPIPADRAKTIAQRIKSLSDSCEYLIPSHDPASVDFDGLRYWRGPAWLIINYMVANGLERAGEIAVSNRIHADSLRLIDKSGFAEYYDPQTAEPCGGAHFTWTAAMVIELIQSQKVAA